MQPAHGPVAILGAGITGLTAAWHLNRLGIPVVVFEASACAGGVIGSTRDGGWLHETGPNSLHGCAPATTALVEGLGLAARRITASPEARNRYIVRGGRLLPLPASPLALAATNLFSLRSKLGLIGEPFRRRAPADADETVAAFVRRRLGREFLQYAADPFVAGVFAGDPERLSLRHAFPALFALEQEHGSLARGALALALRKRHDPRAGASGAIASFPGGLGEIIQAITAALPPGTLRLSSPVAAIGRSADGRWSVEAAGPSGSPAPERFAAVISALPADALASLRIHAGPAGDPLDGLAPLGGIPHPPIVSIALGFRRADVTHLLDGFGFLVPSSERRQILGSLFSSTLFPGRAPEGCVALTTFAGGTRNPEVAALPDPELIRLVRSELLLIVGARGEPVFASIRRWPRAIPQYEIGHGRHAEACTQAEKAAPGLFIGGNFLGGASVPACIASGARLAAAAAAGLARPPPTTPAPTAPSASAS